MVGKASSYATPKSTLTAARQHFLQYLEKAETKARDTTNHEINSLPGGHQLILIITQSAGGFCGDKSIR